MILVTGGTGFIGSHLVERLAAEGESVRCLVRRKDVSLPGQVVYGDLVRNEGLDRALEGVETVIHLAGVIKALRVEGYYAGNTRATENLARAAAGKPVRLVHVSSLAAAGPSRDGTPLVEDAEPLPVSHYGTSKLEAERAVRKLLPEAVIVRPPVVYGPRDTGVFEVLKPLAKGMALEIGGGERFFSAIYVADLVEGLITAARAPQASGRTYYLSHPEPVSWSQFAAVACRIMQITPRVWRVPLALARAVGYCAEVWSEFTRRPGMISRDKVAEAQCKFWTCNPRRAAAELGFEARTPLEAGLARTLAWYKEAGWLSY